MRDVPVAPARPRRPRGRGTARSVLAASLSALGLALPLAANASAATEPGPLAAWDGHPADTREVFPQDGMVLPTDTVVTPPAAGFVSTTTDGPRPQQRGFRYVSPGVAYGLVHWWATRAGQAAGITVTYRNRQTGWSYATTTDVLGRYRVRVPDGSYDLTYTDSRLPDGVWTPASKRVPDYYGSSFWDGGLQQGNFDSVVPRPRFSCVIPAERGSGTDEVVDGVEGWAPGADPATTVCPHLGSVVAGEGDQATQFMIALSTSMNTWGLTGRDPLPPAKDGDSTPKPPSAPGSVTTPVTAATAVPRIARSIRATRGGVAKVRVTWGSGTPRSGRLTLVPSRTRAGKRIATGRTLARGVVRAGARTVTLRLTAAGRRAARVRSAVTVVWTPAGGPATVLSTGRLRVGG